MGEFIIKGPDAETFLIILTSDVKKLSLGCAMYSLLCNDIGGVIDDLIVYKHEGLFPL